MPFVNAAQRRACFAQRARDLDKGITPRWDCYKWMYETEKEKRLAAKSKSYSRSYSPRRSPRRSKVSSKRVSRKRKTNKKKSKKRSKTRSKRKSPKYKTKRY